MVRKWQVVDWIKDALHLMEGPAEEGHEVSRSNDNGFDLKLQDQTFEVRVEEVVKPPQAHRQKIGELRKSLLDDNLEQEMI
jgi:hypothetical protein